MANEVVISDPDPTSLADPSERAPRPLPTRVLENTAKAAALDEDLVAEAKESRTLVLAALGSAAFASISVISIRDCDLLSGAGMVKLPVLDSTVPVSLFFFLCPVFLTLMFLYVQLDLRRVSEKFGPDVVIPVWPLSEMPLRKRGQGITLSIIGLVVVGAIWPLASALSAVTILPTGSRLLGALNLATLAVAWWFTIWNLAKVNARSHATPSGYTVAVAAVPSAVALVAALGVGTARVVPPLYAHYTDFRGAELGALDLSNRNLRGANFAEAQLPQARLSRSDLARATFAEADVQYADFCGALLHDSNFRGVHARRARFRCVGGRGYTPGLSSANFTDADLRVVDLALADLNGAMMSGANLTDAVFWRARLEHADLSGADTTAANFTSVEGDGLRLSGSSGQGCNFYHASLAEARFGRANLQNANFTSANLQRASFSEAILSGAKFTGADLRNADLRGATLDTADITDTTKLDGTLYDRFSKLPADFDPHAHGMKEVR